MSILPENEDAIYAIYQELEPLIEHFMEDNVVDAQEFDIFMEVLRVLGVLPTEDNKRLVRRFIEEDLRQKTLKAGKVPHEVMMRAGALLKELLRHHVEVEEKEVSRAELLHPNVKDPYKKLDDLHQYVEDWKIRNARRRNEQNNRSK